MGLIDQMPTPDTQPAAESGGRVPLARRGTSQTGVRIYHERLVLSLIRTHGSLPKAEIARLTDQAMAGEIDFGDALRLHHAFSAEPFTKDKFEFLLWKTFTAGQVDAALAAKGNPGHDISIAGERFSLKTQADRSVKAERIWISKFMELGRGKWETE